jgi:hypothetical protein
MSVSNYTTSFYVTVGTIARGIVASIAARFARMMRAILCFPYHVYSRIRLNRLSNLDALAICMIMSFGLYAHLAVQGTFNATGDFPASVSYPLNFKLAVADGQWLPRWVVIPREFTFGGGSLDGTTPTADSPAFLYYAFLQSALAFPLLCLGISSVVAVQLVVCLSFGLGAWALFLAARALRAGHVAALLSAYSYIASPWLLSNFYHRGGIAEALSQAALPFLLLGFVWISVGRTRAAVIIITFGIAWLALSHNLFLMLGTGLCGLFGVFYFISNSPRSDTSLSERIRALVMIGIGVGTGILLTAWQWLPAILTLHQTQFEYTGNLHSSHIGVMADYSGVLGFPKLFTDNYYMTIGWWTIPAAIALLVQRTDRRLGWALFGCFVVFFILAYYPQWIMGMLPPGPLGALQFSFRMLAFVSVLGALGISMALPRLSWQLGLAAMALITTSQLPVFLHEMNKQRMPDEAYLRGYEFDDYYAHSPRERNLRWWHNGWLNPENVITFDQNDEQPAFLRIQGTVSPKIGSNAALYLKAVNPAGNSAESPELLPQGPVIGPVEIAGSFDTTLKVASPGWFRIVTEPFDFYESIRPQMVSLIKGPLSSYVFAEEMKKIERGGYKRVFAAPPSVVSQKSADANGLYSVELPMIYNRFSVPYQRSMVLPYECDFNHRILVRVSNLAEPIVVRFELPWQAFALTGLGLIALLLVSWRRTDRNDRGSRADR